MNYMPLHSGGSGVNGNSTQLKVASVKKCSQEIRQELPHKRKQSCDGYSEFEHGYHRSDYCLRKGIEEAVSAKSSTGLGISYSEMCKQLQIDTGKTSERWPPWECPVPSKRRTRTHRHQSFGKRNSHIYSSFRESDSSVYSCVPEEDVLVEYKPSLMTVEIGLGGVLIRPPMSRVLEQESQASSLVLDSKEFDHSASNESMISTVVRGAEKDKKIPKKLDAGSTHNAKNLMPNKPLLENFPYSKHEVLQNCLSPLAFEDIINVDTFMAF